MCFISLADISASIWMLGRWKVVTETPGQTSTPGHGGVLIRGEMLLRLKRSGVMIITKTACCLHLVLFKS